MLRYKAGKGKGREQVEIKVQVKKNIADTADKFLF